MQFCTFQINENLYGVDIVSVKEIKDEFKITPIHHAPQEIKGFVNIRGQVHLVIEISNLLRIDTKTGKIKKHLILFKQKAGGDLFGIIVDKHRGVVNVDERKIEYNNPEIKKISNDSFKTKLTIGVCKLENKLLTILNSDKILSSIVC